MEESGGKKENKQRPRSCTDAIIVPNKRTWNCKNGRDACILKLINQGRRHG